MTSFIETRKPDVTGPSASALYDTDKKITRLVNGRVPIAGGDATWYGDYSTSKDSALIEKFAVVSEMVETKQIPGNEQAISAAIAAITQKDIDAWKEKVAMRKQIDFDTWIGQKYKPSMNPHLNSWLEERCPTWFKSKETYDKFYKEMKHKWLNIKLYGPKNEEDFWLLFRYETDNTVKRVLDENDNNGSDKIKTDGYEDALMLRNALSIPTNRNRLNYKAQPSVKEVAEYIGAPYLTENNAGYVAASLLSNRDFISAVFRTFKRQDGNNDRPNQSYATLGRGTSDDTYIDFPFNNK